MPGLKLARDGERDPLDPLILAELRKLAGHHMRKERDGHTLQPTALVHEAYLRLIQNPRMIENPVSTWESRTHFIAAASQAMRRVLVDHARARRTGKRGGARQQVTLNEGIAISREKTIDLLSLDEALTRLAAFDPRQERIVELHFFGGLSFLEIGEILGLSERTIKSDWSVARVWLHAELSKTNG